MWTPSMMEYESIIIQAIIIIYHISWFYTELISLKKKGNDEIIIYLTKKHTV